MDSIKLKSPAELSTMTRAQLDAYYDALHGRDEQRRKNYERAVIMRRKKREGINTTGPSGRITGAYMYDRLTEMGIKYDPIKGELYRERKSLLSGSGDDSDTVRILIGREDKSGRSNSRWFSVDCHQYRLGVLAWCMAHKQLVLVGGLGDLPRGHYLVHLNGDGMDIRLSNLAIMKNREIISSENKVAREKRAYEIQQDIEKNAGKNKNIVPYGNKGQWAIRREVFGKEEVLGVYPDFETAENKEREIAEIYNASVRLANEL